MLVIGNVLLIDCLGVIVRPGLVVGGYYYLNLPLLSMQVSGLLLF